MAPNSGGGDTKDESVKHLFDRIGQKVYDKLHDDALKYNKQLHGLLENATFSDDIKVSSNPCDLDYNKDTNVTNTVIDPCDKRSEERFSNAQGAECNKSKIKGNKDNEDKESKGEGACAPFRRLSLCDTNLEQIQPHQVTTTDNLLVDVCMAAKFEGQSISGRYPPYKLTYDDSPSQLCTMLARSFADIGDIIRGKDLYRGDNGKDKLEKKLNEIFENIKAKNNSTLKDLSLDKLREYWWALNRGKVWKALTCDAPSESVQYFRLTCSKGTTPAKLHCTCADGDPPTYFDYVPQYLRWFEEWAEDFCRKRKHKLQDVKNKCRGEKDGKKRYCTLNGYDCTQTIRGQRKLIKDSDCNECSYSCFPFRKWIAKQKEEFLKQKEKYNKEIEESTNTTRTIGNATIKNLYEKEFYDKLEERYKSVNSFLELLSEEKICENQPHDGEDKRSINFEKEDDTFSPTEYCEPCPWCGVEPDGPGWKAKPDTDCRKENARSFDNRETTTISVLTPDTTKSDMVQKYRNFCENSDKNYEQMEKWICHYEDTYNDDCVLQNKEMGTPEEKMMPYHPFFWKWVHDMLHDSIDWRKELDNCINYKSQTCRKGCNSDCKCYESWVQQKRTEWGEMKEHFKKQKDIPVEFGYDYVLKNVLGLNVLLTNIKESYGDEQETFHIEKMLKEEEKAAVVGGTGAEEKNTMDLLIEHELEDAEECLEIHDEEKDGKECVEEVEKFRHNPCSGTKQQHRAMVNTVAYDFQQQARDQLRQRGGKKALRGDATKGTYKREGSADNFKKEKLCTITEKDSNDGRPSGQPCEGKGNGLEIGKDWILKSNNETTYADFYLPPRRQHFCTSNLEKINVGNVTKNGKAIHSLLGDVLLAAKYQADWIKKRYHEKNGKIDLTDEKHQATICRAMKYSFADIGDIIRGKDMWDQNREEQTTQDKLKEIFEKIKEKLEQDIKEKYTEDDSKYTQLRADWWEANRRHVWKAMKCALESDKIPCHGMPVEDYIPQWLRWMTEWAEWYCKMQKEEYEKLKGECQKCMEKDKGATCWSSDGEVCKKCTAQCEKYTKEIKEWADQWKKIDEKYKDLYKEATNGKASDKKVKDVVDFLAQLIRKSGNTKSRTTRSVGEGTKLTASAQNTPYSSAAGYIHQEAHIDECKTQEQWVFCNNGGNDKNYAFKSPPNGYDDACGCKSKEAPKAVPAPAAPAPKVETQDVCEIVAKVLTKDQLQKACAQKYSGIQPRLGWKCVASSGTTTAQSGGEAGGGGEARDRELLHRRRRGADSESGAPTDSSKGGLCVPPRRRKLYVGPLEKWARDTTVTSAGEEQPSGIEAASDPHKALRDSFIQSAAVETYFLWDRYKKEKEKEDTETNGREVVQYKSPKPEVLDAQLKDGKIPDDFKRWMFYTLGDYRDILYGNNMHLVGNALSSDQKQAMEKIKAAIEKVFPNGASPPSSEKKPSDAQTRESFWTNHGKSIWEGMICAITYTEKSEEGTEGTEEKTKIDKDQAVYDKFFGKDGEKPDTEGGTYEETYKYEKVKLDEVQSDGDGRINTGYSPSLTEFVKIPTYFRWLHEWGNEFCHKQKHRLRIIKLDCRGENDGKYSSGDGEDCQKIRKEHYDTVRYLENISCAKHCRSYRKWINTKKTEYGNQKGTYNTEHDKAKRNNRDSSFFVTIQNLSDASDFLKTLGPCNSNNERADNEKENDYINFDDENTFRHAKNCDPCPLFGVKCNGNDCSKTNEIECLGKKFIIAQDINANEKPVNLHMLVSDNTTNKSENVLPECRDADIFEGIRKDVWKCGYKCDLDVCVLDTHKNGKLGDKQNIQIRALFKRWLEYFFEDYNIIRKKLKLCMKNGTECSCVNGCYKKCKCIEQWIVQKRDEWQQISKRYMEQYKGIDDDTSNTLTNFLQQSPFYSQVKKAIHPCTTLDMFQESIHCSVSANSQDTEASTKMDIIECLLLRLHNLEEKVKKCEAPSSGENQKQCENSSPLTDNILEDEDDYPLEAPEENGKTNKQHPSFCKIEDPPAAQDEDVCDKPTEAPPNMVEEEVPVETNDDSTDSTDGASGEDGKGKDDVNGEKEQEEEEVKQEVSAPESKATEEPLPKPPEPRPSVSPKETKTKVGKKGGRQPPRQVQQPTKPPYTPSDWRNVMSASAFPWTVGVAFVAMTYWWLLKVRMIVMYVCFCV
nr:erythrocyte membrane protein 1, PfEMP1, putative [Plasmodium sp. DRC-Itaito]